MAIPIECNWDDLPCIISGGGWEDARDVWAKRFKDTHAQDVAPLLQEINMGNKSGDGVANLNPNLNPIEAAVDANGVVTVGHNLISTGNNTAINNLLTNIPAKIQQHPVAAIAIVGVVAHLMLGKKKGR